MGAAEKIQEKRYTFEEYLELEAVAESKSEYWNGNIISLAGGRPNHGKIANNIGTAINNELDKQGKDCSVYNSDVKVYIPTFHRGVYPDCMMICGEEKFYRNSNAVVTNPSLVIEVLSESTKEYDQTSKFEGYRSIPSFKEYVIVWQTIPKVQAWYREGTDLWRITTAFGLDTSIRLYSLDGEIQLKDIYKRVKDLGESDEPNAY